MPPGEWVVMGDPSKGNPSPLIGFGLKECGAVIPLVHDGLFSVGEAEMRAWNDTEDLYHPMYSADG